MSSNSKIFKFRKDESLDRLANSFNVAQFVSFSPGLVAKQEYCRVLGFEPNFEFQSLPVAISELIKRSVKNSVNIRSFRPDDPRSHEFVYGITDVSQAQAVAERILGSGFYIIINETIDVNDGGVSGVLQGGVVEFSPDDTPRCVEKPGTASMSRAWGCSLLKKVYGFDVDFGYDESYRIEFSLHPRPCGWKHTHVLGWELEKTNDINLVPNNIWPNNFSRVIGDKAFGLMLAEQAGLPVPKTTVISRRVAPFSFGEETGSAEKWIRTCPTEQVPGKYTTHHGWLDPFKLITTEDPSGEVISSILSQAAVVAHYSGALIVNAEGKPVIEGTKGEGEAFMLGTAMPEILPDLVIKDVLALFINAFDKLGPVRFEWVHDGEMAWVVQLHKGATSSVDNVIVPGDAAIWCDFDISFGLAALRTRLEGMEEGMGLLIQGQVGLTSHVADVLRKSGIPARIEI